ncbi:MAG: nickel-dependent hydrogenase large subunit [Syntrophobacteraceae bacterium]
MATVTVIDPVTRIEGHLKVEITIDSVGGLTQVTDAKCTGTLFRGFETVLAGRDPRDATVLTQRICGVCPVSHALASTLALESAAEFTAPTNARLLRNLVLGANFLQSHILHFYLLAAPDYVAAPAGAPWSPAWSVDMRTGLGTVSGHIPTAVTARRRAHEMGAVFGGRMPAPHTYVAGGFTSLPDSASITKFRSHLTWLTNFIQNTYIPDVEMVANMYSDFFKIGKGPGNFIAYGVFDQNSSGSSKLLRRGAVLNSAPTNVADINLNSITEAINYSWYQDSSAARNPSNGRTVPSYPKTNAYSWLKAPRYSNRPMEAGPLARMWINGDYRNGVSVMDRHYARAQEALKIAQAMNTWLGQLSTSGAVYSTFKVPASGSGTGLTEAARGALGHWVSYTAGKIANYQVITPTCWNASPQDGSRVKGPMEQALIGTPIQDESQPIEALRVIHSFDPCLSCAVHVMRPNGKPVVIRAGLR